MNSKHSLAFVNAANSNDNESSRAAAAAALCGAGQRRVKVHAAAAALISRLHMREPQSYSICLQNFPACNLKVKPLSLH